MSTHLLQAWSTWRPRRPPHVLQGDEDVLLSGSPGPSLERNFTWRSAIASPRFGEAASNDVHLGLIPQPFIGDLKRASIYVLLLNPGLTPSDYYGEYEVPAFRKALLANLQQDFGRIQHPFLFLNPQFSWHAGFSWWHGKLAKVIAEFGRRRKMSFADARKHIAHRLASIEPFAYHSERFKGGSWLSRLRSAELARTFVHSVVLSRVRQGQAIVIVARRASWWDLPREPRVITYSGMEARGAHLTPTSPGGAAILKHLLAR